MAGGGELLGLPVKPKDVNGVVTFQVEIPNNPALIGTVLHTQAWMYDNSGIYDDALTNAQDLVIQP